VNKAILILLALLAATPARAELLFERDVPRQRALARIYRRALPPRGKTVAVTVGLGVFPNGYIGYYSRPNRQIYLSPNVEERAYYTTFVHEYGHFFVEMLTPQEWNRWVLFWARSPEKMPTDYARSNHYEGFAECFEYFHGGQRSRLHAKVRSLLTRYARPARARPPHLTGPPAGCPGALDSPCPQ